MRYSPLLSRRRLLSRSSARAAGCSAAAADAADSSSGWAADGAAGVAGTELAEFAEFCVDCRRRRRRSCSMRCSGVSPTKFATPASSAFSSHDMLRSRALLVQIVTRTLSSHSTVTAGTLGYLEGEPEALSSQDKKLSEIQLRSAFLREADPRGRQISKSILLFFGAKLVLVLIFLDPRLIQDQNQFRSVRCWRC